MKIIPGGKGDVKRTPNLSVNHLTFCYDLDVESAELSHRFCTLSL